VHHRTLRRLGADEAAFTLIEIMIVLIVIAVLMAIAVPSYLGMRQRAEEKLAKSNIRAAIPALEAYSLDNIGVKGDADGKKNTTGYKGATIKILREDYDAGLSPTLKIVAGKTDADSFCLADTHGKNAWSALGPGVENDSFVNNAKCK
jgi:prepilin-type N-terminal cleavage/methylation domain-containing protein